MVPHLVGAEAIPCLVLVPRELFEQHLMGYTMRTDRYRLVLWVDDRRRREEPIAVELYDPEKEKKFIKKQVEINMKLKNLCQCQRLLKK